MNISTIIVENKKKSICLTQGQLNKYIKGTPYKRHKTFLEKIKSSSEFMLANGETVILKNCQENIENVMAIAEERFNHRTPFLDINDNPIRLNEIRKTKEFGSSKSDSNDSNTSELQESLFCLILDYTVQNDKSPSKQEILEYSPSKKLKNSTPLQDIHQFVNENDNWFNECSTMVKTIMANISKLYKLSEYEIHHNTELFQKIKKTGAELAELGQDKWNPSDVFLIRDYNPSSVDLNDRLAYNSYIHNPDLEKAEVIGISLKASKSLHGAFSLRNLGKQFGFEVSTKYKTYNSTETKTKFKKLIKEIAKKYKEDEFCYFISEIVKDKFAGVDGLVQNSTDLDEIYENLKKLEKAGKLGNNHFKSLIPALEFLADVEDIRAAVKYAVLIAMSIDISSCPHYKVYADKFYFINSSQISQDIELKHIKIKLNGDNDVIFEIDVNGSLKKFQLRSKDTLPQFILYDRVDTTHKKLDIKKLELN